MQKFGRRTVKNIWSKKNIEHIERLIKDGRIQPAGKLLKQSKQKATGIGLMINKKATAFFKTLNRTNLFSIGFRLQKAKKEEIRLKRMESIVDMLGREKKFH